MLAYYVEGSRFMMLGSMHALPHQLAQSIKEFLDSFLGPVQLLLVESDMDAKADFGFTLLPAGQSLEDIVGNEFYGRVQDLAAGLGLREEIQVSKPWWAAILFGIHLLERAGFSVSNGVDRMALDIARSTGTEVIALETSESALAGFNDAPRQEQLDFLRFAVDHQGQAREEFEALLRGWLTGDEDALGKILEERLAMFPEMFHSLIVARNRQWLRRIEDALGRGVPTLLIAGAMHFAGPDSLPALLREQGYAVVKIQPPTPRSDA